MGDFTSEKEQKLLESEAEVSNTEDTNRKRNSLDMTSKTRSSLSVSLR